MGKILGIDLGTTNSVMAVWDGREPRLIASEQGSRLTPSVVGFGVNGDIFVGEVARRQAVANATRTVSSVKRFMGQDFASSERDRETVTYPVVEGDDGRASVRIGDDLWTPEQISAEVLGELKRSAEAFLGEPVEGAVITVPAYFNDAQRTATKEAGRLAGLEVRRIINEPTAAALAYGLDKQTEKIVAVYDFGGGTFDVSILSIGDDVIEVIATHGDTHLGGNDIDTRIVVWLTDQFREKTGVQIQGDAVALQRLREAAEAAKIDLSSRTATEINLPFLASNDQGPLHLEVALSRDHLEEMIGDLVDRTLAACVQALTDAGRKPNEIDDIVLVGGSSRIPLVQQKVTGFFRKEPRRTVNPDEVVALGAAVQAGVISGEVKGLVLLDVTSLSLGVETHDGKTAVVIPRNTTIPTEAMRTFTTATDRQTSVEIHVIQGEGEFARFNDSLGRFDLEGLNPAPAGTPQIDVTFAIDLNGMVKVSARDRGTGRSQTVSVTATTAVSRDPEVAGLAEGHEPHEQEPQNLSSGARGRAAEAGAARKSGSGQAAEKQAKGAKGGRGRQGGAGSVAATLADAERLLVDDSGRLSDGERETVEKVVRELRELLDRKAADDELERSRSAVHQVATRVRTALLSRRA